MNDIEITPREEIRIKGMLSQDNEDNKFKYDLRYQQEILSMLLMDKTFLLQSVDLIKPQYFSEYCHQIICSVLFDYFQKYKHLPPKYTLINEIKELKKDDPKLYYYLGEIDGLIASYAPGLECRDACLDKIADFAKEMALKSALSHTIDMLKKNSQDKWVRIRTLFKEALIVDRNFEMGLDYFQTADERYLRMAQKEAKREVFATGFKSIDDALNGGLCRGEIGAYMGLPGTGKSILLVKAAKHNIAHGKKVLYVSLEMDEDKIAKRFDAQFAKMPISDLTNQKDEVIRALRGNALEYEDKRRLIIKQFPAGTANVDTIRAYMAQLNLFGFKPDLLIVDYVGEMKDIDGIKTYESRQRLVRDLRGFGVEEQHCTLTAMQPNRRGRDQQEEGVIDDDSLGDSFGQARPLDALWSINQRPDEKKMNIGRLFIVKHRDGKSRMAFPFKQDEKTLDVEEIHESTYHEIKSKCVEIKSNENDKNIKTFQSRRNFNG